MPEQNLKSWFTGPLVRLARRILDGIAVRVAHRVCVELKLHRLEQPEHVGMRINLDYRFHPRARWGRAWDLPPHRQLETIIRGQDTRVRQALVSIVSYREELRQIPVQAAVESSATPRWVNGWLPGLDGAALYAFVRDRKPTIYWEVGSGNSTRFVRQAISDGGLSTRIVSIDPSPRAEIDPLCDEIIRAPLEDVGAVLSSRMLSGDICFVDCSHRAFQNSDVVVAMLEILPALPADVLVGFHDIFLPDDYPPDWAERYYNEQYLLAMFLLGGHAGMEIVLPTWDASRRPELASIVAPIWVGAEFAEVERHGDAFWLKSVSDYAVS